MCNHTSRHAWKMCYFDIKIRRQFFMASMEPCMVRRMVAHFGQPTLRCSWNVKHDLSGLSGFFRQLRSKSCLKMSGLRGFWTVYLKKTLKNRARFERFWAVYLKKKTLKNRARFERFWAVFLDKPLKTVQILHGFWAVFLDKPFKNRSNRSFWSKILSVIV